MGVLASEVPTGVIADVISRRFSIILAFLMMGSAMALAGVFEAFWLLALSQIAWGIGWTMQSGANVAWLTDELRDPERVEKLVLTRSRVEVAANAAGVPIALILNLLLTRSGAIAVASMSLFVWGLVLMVVMPERGFTRHEGAAFAEFKRVLSLGGRLTLRTPSLRIIAISTLLGGFASEVIDRLDVARLFEVGIPDDMDEVVLVSLLMLAKAVAAIAVLRLVERRIVSYGAARWMTLFYLGAAAAVAVAAGSGRLGLVLVAFVVQEGLRYGIDPLETLIANRHDESDARATVLSFMSQAHAAGEIIGGVTLGILATATSVSTAFFFAVAVFVLAGLVAGRAERAAPVAAG
ncbi:MAG: MFS transporter [Acidimicrobiales bacterium]|nr:MFS transporter [Acidimicrobiales bacterium]